MSKHILYFVSPTVELWKEIYLSVICIGGIFLLYLAIQIYMNHGYTNGMKIKVFTKSFPLFQKLVQLFKIQLGQMLMVILFTEFT